MVVNYDPLRRGRLASDIWLPFATPTETQGRLPRDVYQPFELTVPMQAWAAILNSLVVTLIDRLGRPSDLFALT